VKKASIIGLGNIVCGDIGAGCYIVDILQQEPLGESVEVSYLAEAAFYAGTLMCGTDFGVVVQAVNMGGPPGKIYCWDKSTFEQNFDLLAARCASMKSLAKGIARAVLSEIFPSDLMFVWIEPKVTEGILISPEMRKALRKAVHLIKDNLFQRGFMDESAFRLLSIYRLEVLCSTA
jgi:hydrogenase maturation protease